MFRQSSATASAAGPVRRYPTEIKALTSLRFFAAFWVVLYHLVWGLPGGSDVHYTFISEGYVAVDFFFILSGFILFHAHKNQIAQHNVPTRSFISRRLARIYPMHFVTLLFYIIIFVAATLAHKALPNPDRYDATQFLLNLFLLHAWQIHDLGAFNFPSWSVSAEWFAYLLFPVIAYKINNQKGVYPAAFALLAAVAYLILTWLLSPILLGLYLGDLHSNFGIVRILPEFILGMALYNFSMQTKLTFLNQPWIVPTVVVVILVFALLQLDMIFTTLIFALLIVALAERSCGGQSGLLETKLLIYLGEISYSVYMVHEPVATVVYQSCGLLHRPVTPSVVVVVALLIVPVASISHRYIEVPGRRFVRKILGDRQERNRLAAAKTD